MEISGKEKARTVRNLVIFTFVTLSCGFVGIGLDRLSPPATRMQGLGALIWLVSPLAANLILRAVGGDGWKDFGLWPKLKASWRWYVVALFLAPLVTLAALAMGTLLGAVSLSGFSVQGLGAFLPLVGGVFIAVMVKNIFEEFAWRGYLTPRFEAIKLHPFASAILTGFIWAGWHLPYYLYFLDRAELQKHTTLNMLDNLAAAQRRQCDQPATARICICYPGRRLHRRPSVARYRGHSLLAFHGVGGFWPLPISHDTITQGSK